MAKLKLRLLALASMQALENEALQDIAVEVQQRLKQVIQNLN
jgi:hypothetical protein